MQTFPIGTYVIAMNTTSRTGGGGSGGGDDEDELLTFFTWFNWIMGGVLLLAAIFMCWVGWRHQVVHRESHKIELFVSSTKAKRTTGKSKKDYWLITLSDNNSAEYEASLKRRGTDEVYALNKKFTTFIVWHTLRNGEKHYYLPDLGQDIPKLQSDGNQN